VFCGKITINIISTINTAKSSIVCILDNFSFLNDRYGILETIRNESTTITIGIALKNVGINSINTGIVLELR